MTDTIIEILVTSSVLIAVLALVRRVFSERLSARFMYALWLVVVLRLFIPVSVQSAFSMMNAVKPVTDTVVGVITVPVAPMVSANIPDAVTNTTGINATYTTEMPQSPNLPENAANERVIEINWIDVLIIIWLAGAAIILSYTVITNLRYRKNVFADSKLLDCSPMLTYLGVRRKARVIVSGYIAGPCLIGIFRPTVAVTPEIAANPPHLEYVLMHEAGHLKQHDNLWAVVRGIACIAYWFNPLVWVAGMLSKKDCEFSCDALVMKGLDKERRLEYGETLINVIRANGK